MWWWLGTPFAESFHNIEQESGICIGLAGHVCSDVVFRVREGFAWKFYAIGWVLIGYDFTRDVWLVNFLRLHLPAVPTGSAWKMHPRIAARAHQLTSKLRPPTLGILQSVHSRPRQFTSSGCHDRSSP